jgi:hypothetical protein
MHFHQLVALYSLHSQSAVEFDSAGNMRKQDTAARARVYGGGGGQSNIEWRVSGSN